MSIVTKNYLKKILFISFFMLFSTFSYSQNNDEIFIGNKNAKVEIKIYSSFTCPHCANFHFKVIPDIIKEYVERGKVQLIFIDFPLLLLCNSGTVTYPKFTFSPSTIPSGNSNGKGAAVNFPISVSCLQAQKNIETIITISVFFILNKLLVNILISLTIVSNELYPNFYILIQNPFKRDKTNFSFIYPF